MDFSNLSIQQKSGITSDVKIGKKSYQQLQRGVKQSLKYIKSNYKKIVNLSELTLFERLIYENYYLIEREAKVLLKTGPEGNVSTIDAKPILGDAVLHIFAEKGKISNSDIINAVKKIQSRRYISGSEIDGISWQARYSAVREIAAGFASKDDKKLSEMIKLLAALDSVELEVINNEVNPIEKLYNFDKEYSKMSESTRSIYRNKTSKIAYRKNEDEQKLAQKYLTLARAGTGKKAHIGYYLYKEYDELFPIQSVNVYISMLFIFSAILSAGISLLTRSAWLWAVIYLPLYAAVKPVVDFFTHKKGRHEPLPRMELNGDIPDNAKTLVTISTLLSGAGDINKLSVKLEKLYYANPSDNLYFCLLCDLRQSDKVILAEDKPIISAAQQMIDALNKKLGNRFCIIIRGRTYSPTQGEYTGFERKRGAVEELIGYMKGAETEFAGAFGCIANLREITYLCALDLDTKALMDTVSELVGIALHPLNKAEVSGGRVRRGYGIIAPRAVITLKSSLKSPFSKIMGGAGGTCTYDSFAADIYQDCFGEGIFAGKGLIDIDVFYKLCCNKFVNERVLSHDILEGNFARTAYAGDVEFCDSFPPGSVAYFKRLHRWLRGDLQNTPYIQKNIPTKKGKVPNPFNSLGKFKLTDNIRRCVTPVFTLTCFFIAAYVPGYEFVALIGIFSVLTQYMIGFVPSVLTGGFFSISRKFYSGALSQSTELICQSLMQLLLIPKNALVSLDAVIRVFWRTKISHKNLLEWTTASQSDSAKTTPVLVLRHFWPAELVGLALVISPSYVMRLAGVYFLAALPMMIYCDRPYKKQNRGITQRQREELTTSLAAMWQFYEDYAAGSDNYLPVDNMQKAPVYAIAHRTSPTNIGLMMLCALSARDFNIINTESLYQRIDRTLETVEKLEKWNGNLYNWYDTQSLAILRPGYVSSVDSGNFVCCMVALKEGLKEYAGEKTELLELVKRLETIIDETDISVFYNSAKKLMSIGFDPVENKFSQNHYDLLMSEARMTSYFAIAKRQVPKKHWRFLGRTMAKINRYTGPVSWTGTMFEYFMPEILLRCEEGSMGYEGLRFCLHSQKKRALSEDIPFGFSESAYYAFDSQLNYQYKAHGVQKIGLRRDLDSEAVVSPYSSFLTLAHDFHSSYANLQRLKSMAMNGSYGYYEAVDFTPERVGASDGKTVNYAVIKSYMAHHLGMSILSVSNALNDNIMQKRFMADSYMDSASELLEEKIISGSIVFEDVYKKQPPRRENRETKLSEQFKSFSAVNPRVNLLCNGEYTAVTTDIGVTNGIYQGKDTILRTTDIIRNPHGAFFAVAEHGEVFNLTHMPSFDNTENVKIGRISKDGKDNRDKGAEREVVFSQSSTDYYSNEKNLRMGMKVSVHPYLPCEIRSFAVKNVSNKKRQTILACYIEPTLCTHTDWAAHPSFMKLFIKLEYDRHNKVFIASRKERNSDNTIYFAAGFAEDADFTYSLLREDVLTANDGVFSCFNKAERRETVGEQVPDPCIFIRANMFLDAYEQKTMTLFMCTAMTKDDLINNIQQIRHNKELTGIRVPSPLINSTIEGRLAQSLLPQVLYGIGNDSKIAVCKKSNRLPVTKLWGLGISGDYPIVLTEFDDAAKEDKIVSYIKAHHTLKLAQIPFDLVIAYNDNGQYNRPLHTLINYHIKKIGSSDMVSKRGGVHLVDYASVTDEIKNLLKAASCHIGSDDLLPVHAEEPEFKPIKLQKINRSRVVSKGKGIAYGEFDDNGFTVTDTPPHTWCHVLANPAFGTLVSNGSLGFTWAVNSRENKLTPWSNDLMTDNMGEMLILKSGREYFDIICGSAAKFTPSKAVYAGTVNNITAAVQVSVPVKGSYKHINVSLENKTDKIKEVSLALYTEPLLNADNSTARQISGEVKENALILRNPFNQAISGYMYILTDSNADNFTMSRTDFWSGNWEIKDLNPNSRPCGAVIIKRQLPPKERIKIRFILGFARTEKAVNYQLNNKNKLFGNEKSEIAESKNTITINTPDIMLNYIFNTWLMWQTIGCRIYARTGFYQNGGAYGFRDQLQDSAAVIYSNPKLCKTQIIRACASQFPEGDVLHWWHKLPGVKKGVRTRYSDDLLWLPYVVCEYVDKTSDKDILDITVNYCSGELLADNQHEIYMEVGRSDVSANVYGHCKAAIEKAYKTGSHDLPLIGCGDWNDGYNEVGIGGKGESVWLAMFMVIVMGKFAKIAEERGEKEYAHICRKRISHLKSAIDKHCWDGSHYIRAFYDNGEMMGSRVQDECKIDSLPQSFAILCGMEDVHRNVTAIDSAMRQLVDFNNNIIRLFTPALGRGKQKAGYVTSYPAGVRENGGQYTHAAVWFCMAVLELGNVEDGYKLVQMLNPANRYLNSAEGDRYKNEPYYMSADIYTNPECYGRGGWSIYTGAAGWYYRAILENLMGIKISGGKVTVTPKMPKYWDKFEVTLNFGDTEIVIDARKGGGYKLWDNGTEKEYIALDGQKHEVRVYV